MSLAPVAEAPGPGRVWVMQLAGLVFILAAALAYSWFRNYRLTPFCEGTVVDQSGQPVANALVVVTYMTPRRESDRMFSGKDSKTDQQGRFSIRATDARADYSNGGQVRVITDRTLFVLDSVPITGECVWNQATHLVIGSLH